ncbi:TIGR02530 family flagellar biosynthesis protein [Salibacterium halotolerans]|uniref:Flagellar operon protein n=1 Tax=Salibacterium halotolerans TaxID=1884432 RepID=A0A1I5MDM8_9BACI|nr:TIGR02530 family flagellar biosynthesis protein [Salibacterium halotolerans]SFP07619.1 flagellar operon protein [Salibacterium halotolerans]
MSSGIQPGGLHQLPHPGTSAPKQKTAPASSGPSFQEVLNGQLETSGGLKVSRHAEKRLHDRDVIVTNEQWQKISGKMEEARTKGVKDAVVFTDSSALVVSAQNNTVITAMQRNEASDHIFTNIDGTFAVND